MTSTDDYKAHCVTEYIALYTIKIWHSFISYTKLKKTYSIWKKDNLSVCYRNNDIRHLATMFFINLYEASLADELEALLLKINFDTNLKDNINLGCSVGSYNIYVTKLT